MLNRIRAALGRMWRPRRRRTAGHGSMTSVPEADIAGSRTQIRPEGKATETRRELVASEVPAACPGGKASSLPEVEGEAGMPVAVMLLPGRRLPAGPALSRCR
jgi:hypothetical protein